MEVYPDSLLTLRIGQYRVTRELARGGMGVVYEALHEVIGQRAAVKVLLSTRDPASTYPRLLREAQAVSLVQHPGMVRIFDFGRLPAGAPYILMELVEGEPLRARLMRLDTRLELRSASRITRQIATTLAAAHARGVVHQDLKPENVMLVPDEEVEGGERVKLLDFGLARFVGRDTPLAAEGGVLGTAAYMAPEQCAGSEDIDGQADVYALGVLLYELISQGPPFRGQPTAVMWQHLFQEPPPLPGQASLPAGLLQLLWRMLAKAPSRRPRMLEVAESLRRLERASPAKRRPAGLQAPAQAPSTPRETEGVPTRPGRRRPPARAP